MALVRDDWRFLDDFRAGGRILLPSAQEKEQDEIRDKAYRESLKKIPDAKTSNDPWGGVRSTDAPKPATAAKPKAKTGATSN